MKNVIKFPGVKDFTKRIPERRAKVTTKKVSIPTFFVNLFWVVVVLVWPLLKWIVALDVLFQFIRMVYHWDNPDMNAGWVFLMHFAVLTVLTYFVTVFKPKDI